MTLTEFNRLDKSEATKLLFSCCGSSNWASFLAERFPFRNEMELLTAAEDIWYEECGESDWLESFKHHPKIGDIKSLTEKFAGKEQAAVATATKEVIELLAKANAEYEHTFGFIFIVCATGKSAAEMLRLLNDRMNNGYEEELGIAMGEQHKITVIRFKKLLD